MRLGSISDPVGVSNHLLSEVIFVELDFVYFYLIMLLAGSILTVITIARMCSGKINIPLWAKILLSIAMIAMLLITLLGMLPTRTITVTTDQITQIIIPNQD